MFSLRPEKIKIFDDYDNFINKENNFIFFEGLLVKYRFSGVLSSLIIKTDDEELIQAYIYDNDFEYFEGKRLKIYFNVDNLIPLENT